jgi:hypothetical protein
MGDVEWMGLLVGFTGRCGRVGSRGWVIRLGSEGREVIRRDANMTVSSRSQDEDVRGDRVCLCSLLV